MTATQVPDRDGARLYVFRVLSGSRSGELKSFAGILLKRQCAISALTASARRLAPGRAQRAVAVFENGRQIYASAGWSGAAETRTAVGGIFPLWDVAAGYSGTTVEDLTRAQFRRNLLLAGLAVVGLGLGLLLALGATAREARLARMKAGFVSSVSHEMKTPLALIRMYSETLDSGRITAADKRTEYYRVIRREAEKLTRLIEDVLDFARLDAGGAALRFEHLDLADLAGEIARGFETRLREAGFDVVFEARDSALPVVGDRSALIQAIGNVIDNAAKFSVDRRKICVATWRRGDEALVEVTDSGIGIPTAEQDRIFEKFYRGEDPRVRSVRGAGLGLTLSRQIVQAHRGRMAVRSVPGEGSTFSIVLPAVRDSEPVEEAQAACR